MTASLRIDRTRCAGHGICALLAPDVVDLDSWGFPELQEGALDPQDLARVRRAVAACPRRALSVEEMATPVQPLRAPWQP